MDFWNLFDYFYLWELVLITIIAIIGFVIVRIVASRPKLFWPIFVAVAVGTAGLMVAGYCLIDEYLTGCVLFGALLAISTGTVPLRKDQKDSLNQLHRYIFLLMVVYMVFQSMRGLFLWKDWRLIRWIIFYVVLGELSFIISRRDFLFPSLKQVSLIISWSALLYLGLYIAHGLFSEAIRGFSRWTVQGIEWSGPAYATFPIVISIPGALFLLKDGAPRHRWISRGVLLLAVIATFYYDTRIALAAILVFLVNSRPLLKFHKVILFLFIFLFIFGFCLYFSNAKEIMTGESYTFQMPRKADSDRYAHLLGAFITVNRDWKSFLFGYGIHSHRFVIDSGIGKAYKQYVSRSVFRSPPISIDTRPIVRIIESITKIDLKHIKLPTIGTIIQPDMRIVRPGKKSIGSLYKKSIVRTEAFTALLVDTGLIGMLLLLTNFLFTAQKIFIQRSPGRFVLLAALLLSFLWLPISNIQDMVLFYLLVMPSGLLIQLGSK